ncbi:HNH endonuclease [Mycolicibacterium arenosum]|uniref:HNH endonuclease n=1 Tax=Mycolicibacterium arenosum TaxID=2952157 RepID=UPI0038CD6FC1
MTDADDGVQAMESVAAEIGMSALDAVSEKLDELRARNFLRLFPSGILSLRQRRDYLELVLGREPTDSELEGTLRSYRELKLDEAERLELEDRQNSRCALCGALLTTLTNPHVDHVVPIALGGSDTMSNLQLLCQACNLGKGKLPSWHLGVPYFEHRLTPKLRYCVLARAKGRCYARLCDSTARYGELVVMQSIPSRFGGGWQFDNLIAVCLAHAQELQALREPKSFGVVRQRHMIVRR